MAARWKFDQEIEALGDKLNRYSIRYVYPHLTHPMRTAIFLPSRRKQLAAFKKSFTANHRRFGFFPGLAGFALAGNSS
jgi:hypothetical protein